MSPWLTGAPCLGGGLRLKKYQVLLLFIFIFHGYKRLFFSVLKKESNDEEINCLRKTEETKSNTEPNTSTKLSLKYYCHILFCPYQEKLIYLLDQPIHKDVLWNILLLRGSWSRCESKRNGLLYSSLYCNGVEIKHSIVHTRFTYLFTFAHSLIHTFLLVLDILY